MMINHIDDWKVSLFNANSTLMQYLSIMCIRKDVSKQQQEDLIELLCSGLLLMEAVKDITEKNSETGRFLLEELRKLAKKILSFEEKHQYYSKYLQQCLDAVDEFESIVLWIFDLSIDVNGIVDEDDDVDGLAGWAD